MYIGSNAPDARVFIHNQEIGKTYLQTWLHTKKDRNIKITKQEYLPIQGELVVEKKLAGLTGIGVVGSLSIFLRVLLFLP